MPEILVLFVCIGGFCGALGLAGFITEKLLHKKEVHRG